MVDDEPDLCLLIKGNREDTTEFEEMVYSKKKNQFHRLPSNPMVRERGQIVEGKDPEALSKAYGVDDYISKPFTTELLIQVIKDVLQRTSKRKEE